MVTYSEILNGKRGGVSSSVHTFINELKLVNLHNRRNKLMGLISFLSRIFGIRLEFNGTPEMFLAMVIYMQKKNNPNYSEREVLQWAAVLQKIVKVNLSPYKDFTDLLEHGTPDFSMMHIVDGKIKEHNQRVELKKAIYGPDAELGDDDSMTSKSEDAVAARKFVKDLSKYVKFSDEDQRKLDDL